MNTIFRIMWKGFIPAGRKATMLVMEPCLHSRIILPAFISKLRNAAVMLINFSLSSFFYCLSTFKVRIKLPFCHSLIFSFFLCYFKDYIIVILMFSYYTFRKSSGYLYNIEISPHPINLPLWHTFPIGIKFVFSGSNNKTINV